MATSAAQIRAVKKYNKKMKQLHLVVSPEFHKTVNEAAKQRGCSVTALIREAVTEYLKEGLR